MTEPKIPIEEQIATVKKVMEFLNSNTGLRNYELPHVISTLQRVQQYEAVVDWARKYADATEHREEDAVRGGLLRNLIYALAALDTPAAGEDAG